MNTVIDRSELHQRIGEHFSDFENQLNGSKDEAIHQVRRQAMAAFQKLGFPTKKNEEYKYTPTAPILNKKFDFKDIFRKPSPSFEPLFISGLEGQVVTVVNGQLTSPLPESEGGVSFERLAESSRGLHQWSHYADYGSDAFTALNTAFVNEGLSINIQEGAILEQPIIIYHFGDSREAQAYGQPRNLILAGARSQATIVEIFQTSGGHSIFTNAVTEIVVGEKANLNYYKVVNEPGDAFHVGTTQVQQATGSTFTGYNFTVGGQLVRNNLNIVLDGSHCESHMFGLYLLHDDDHVDNHTTVDHRIRDSFSNELYKGILSDRSTGVFNGKIFVRPDAQKTNAFQSNKNILLSDEATMNTKPQLEIWADDVKCSHGATTGQIDREQLFYLRSRGLSKAKARAMLLHAFAEDVLDQIKVAGLKDYLEDILNQRLDENS